MSSTRQIIKNIIWFSLLAMTLALSSVFVLPASAQLADSPWRCSITIWTIPGEAPTLVRRRVWRSGIYEWWWDCIFFYRLAQMERRVLMQTKRLKKDWMVEEFIKRDDKILQTCRREIKGRKISKKEVEMTIKNPVEVVNGQRNRKIAHKVFHVCSVK